MAPLTSTRCCCLSSRYRGSRTGVEIFRVRLVVSRLVMPSMCRWRRIRSITTDFGILRSASRVGTAGQNAGRREAVLSAPLMVLLVVVLADCWITTGTLVDSCDLLCAAGWLFLSPDAQINIVFFKFDLN